MTLRVVVGGARSGKSSLAVRMAAANGQGRVVFVATGAASDEEMADRIARHRAERPPAWATLEEPTDLARAIRAVDETATVIVDCLTLWLANVLHWPDADIQRHTTEAAGLAARRPGLTIAVSNEVGSGIVPVGAGVRRYRDLLGMVNATWARAAEAAWLVVAGRVLSLDSPDAVIDG